MESSDDRILDAADRQDDLLLYDYFKHMTTLSLVTLGGILSISQSAGVELPLARLLPALGLVALGGTSALYGMERVITLRHRNDPVGAMRWQRWATGGSFGLGIGAFLGEFMNVLGR